MARAVIVAVLTAPGLSGCADGAAPAGPEGAEGTAAVEAVVAASDDALEGVLRDVARTLRLERARGSRSFTICGDGPSPRGVVTNSFVHFDSASGLTRQKATAAAVALLEADGWTVDDPGDQVLLTAGKGRLLLQLQIAPSLVQVDLGSECIETSGDVARAYDARPVAGLEDLPAS